MDNANLTQKNFEVSPSTYALAVAYQDVRLTDTQVSSSRLKSYNAAIDDNGQEKLLNRFFVNYAGQNYPSPDGDCKFDEANLCRL